MYFTVIINLIKCLLDRAWKICSNHDLFHQEILHLKEVLRKNDYPISVIDKKIEEFLNNKFISPHKNTGTFEYIPKKKISFVLPYFNDKMEDFKRRLLYIVIFVIKLLETNLMLPQINWNFPPNKLNGTPK